jgi:hypothetical protein
MTYYYAGRELKETDTPLSLGLREEEKVTIEAKRVRQLAGSKRGKSSSSSAATLLDRRKKQKKEMDRKQKKDAPRTPDRMASSAQSNPSDNCGAPYWPQRHSPDAALWEEAYLGKFSVDLPLVIYSNISKYLAKPASRQLPLDVKNTACFNVLGDDPSMAQLHENEAQPNRRKLWIVTTCRKKQGFFLRYVDLTTANFNMHGADPSATKPRTVEVEFWIRPHARGLYIDCGNELMRTLDSRLVLPGDGVTPPNGLARMMAKAEEQNDKNENVSLSSLVNLSVRSKFDKDKSILKRTCDFTMNQLCRVTVKLCEFQKQTVEWMLRKENSAVHCMSTLFWEPVLLPEGLQVLYSPYFQRFRFEPLPPGTYMCMCMCVCVCPSYVCVVTHSRCSSI